MARFPVAILLLALTGLTTAERTQHIRARNLKSSSSIDDTATASPTDDAATTAPTDGQDPEIVVELTSAPTEVEEVDLAVVESAAPSAKSGCETNPGFANVGIDIQPVFMDFESVACGVEDDAAIAAAIETTLNQFFPTTVDNWDGTVKFADFKFDPAQLIDQVLDTQTRKLRGKDTSSRRMQEDTCTPRNTACPEGYCRWGCIDASTYDCGGDSPFEKWSDLGNDLTQALQELAGLNDIDCLGITDKLRVVLTLPDDEDDETPTPTAAPTDAPVVAEDPVDVRAADLSFTDGDDIFHINSKIVVDFFAGGNGEEIVGTTKMETFTERFEQLMGNVLMNNPEHGKKFAKFKVEGRFEDYDADTRTLTVNFKSLVEYEAGANESEHLIAKELALADFEEHVKTLRSYEIGGIHQIIFTATGTGE